VVFVGGGFGGGGFPMPVPHSKELSEGSGGLSFIVPFPPVFCVAPLSVSFLDEMGDPQESNRWFIPGTLPPFSTRPLVLSGLNELLL